MTSDAKIRERALDIRQSFIVQAPAGSGKTELLTQRYLKLLAQGVQAPEHIVALTFTKKAAREMKDRVLLALKSARNDTPPTAPHQKTTWEIARAVLAQNAQHEWQLLENPMRLRILTIDALAVYLNQRMPLLSRTGGKPALSDNPAPLYELAIERFLEQNQDTEIFSTLLLHLDNRVSYVTNLLKQILARREQWLPHIIKKQNDPEALRQSMEAALQHLNLDLINAAYEQLSTLEIEFLTAHSRYAQKQLTELGLDHLLCHVSLGNTLTLDLSQRDTWQAIATLLLTKSGQWRKTLTKKQGFPKKSEEKMELLDFIDSVRENEGLRIALVDLITPPSTHYDEATWTLIRTLLECLPLLAAHLNIVFQQYNCLDFVALNLNALQALGSEENPTELALYLDFQIQHLLIDEYQDTSLTQLKLIEKLTVGWQQTDGRTVFLVGDPMQSIYRFRQADVGLFIQSKYQGLGGVSLESLTLEANFRSQSTLVEWFNSHFVSIFPQAENPHSGAITYSPSISVKDDTPSRIHFHPIDGDIWDEATHLTTLTQTLLTQYPEDSIAILVRSRSHLKAILPQLEAAKLTFSAVDIYPLSHYGDIQDLMQLTRAILHRGDALSWLCVLRAPFCGLLLQDLQHLKEAQPQHCLWESISDQINNERLSEDARTRLQQIIPLFQQAFTQLGRCSLVQLIKALWTQLGGPLCVTAPRYAINTFFRLLLAWESSDETSIDALATLLEKQFSNAPEQEITRLQVMTIHKSKGLEFDHVILPGLSRRTASDKPPLLRWLERPTQGFENDLILAPIREYGASDEPIYTYLSRLEKERQEHESRRLLYVATTRAKSHLYLSAIFKTDETKPNGIVPPEKSSFMGMLWTRYHSQISTETLIQPQQKNALEPSTKSFGFRRLKLDPRGAPEDGGSGSLRDDDIGNPENDEQNNLIASLGEVPSQPRNPQIPLRSSQSTLSLTSSLLGILMHELLECIGKKGSELFSHTDWQVWHTALPFRLKAEGLTTDQISLFQTRLKACYQNIGNSQKAQWILSTQHQDAYCEFAIQTQTPYGFKEYIIDRTFIDSEGQRWIIDYKSGRPNSDEQALFLAQQKAHHQKQLEQYAQALSQLSAHPIRLALYFPFCDSWLSWEDKTVCQNETAAT